MSTIMDENHGLPKLLQDLKEISTRLPILGVLLIPWKGIWAGKEYGLRQCLAVNLFKEPITLQTVFDEKRILSYRPSFSYSWLLC